MESIVASLLGNYLSIFLTNFSRDDFSLKFFKGQTELRNVEMNTEVLQDLINRAMPNLEVKRAFVDVLKFDVPFTQITTQPVTVRLNSVDLHLAEADKLGESIDLVEQLLGIKKKPKALPASRKHSALDPNDAPVGGSRSSRSRSRKTSAFQDDAATPRRRHAGESAKRQYHKSASRPRASASPNASGVGSDDEEGDELEVCQKTKKYWFGDKIIDGLKVEIGHIKVTIQTLGYYKTKVYGSWTPPSLVMEISDMRVYQTDSEFREPEHLKEAREYSTSRPDVYVFKQVTGSMSMFIGLHQYCPLYERHATPEHLAAARSASAGADGSTPAPSDHVTEMTSQRATGDKFSSPPHAGSVESPRSSSTGGTRSRDADLRSTTTWRSGGKSEDGVSSGSSAMDWVVGDLPPVLLPIVVNQPLKVHLIIQRRRTTDIIAVQVDALFDDFELRIPLEYIVPLGQAIMGLNHCFMRWDLFAKELPTEEQEAERLAALEAAKGSKKKKKKDKEGVKIWKHVAANVMIDKMKVSIVPEVEGQQRGFDINVRQTEVCIYMPANTGDQCMFVVVDSVNVVEAESGQQLFKSEPAPGSQVALFTLPPSIHPDYADRLFDSQEYRQGHKKASSSAGNGAGVGTVSGFPAALMGKSRDYKGPHKYSMVKRKKGFQQVLRMKTVSHFKIQPRCRMLQMKMTACYPGRPFPIGWAIDGQVNPTVTTLDMQFGSVERAQLFGTILYEYMTKLKMPPTDERHHVTAKGYEMPPMLIDFRILHPQVQMHSSNSQTTFEIDHIVVDSHNIVPNDRKSPLSVSAAIEHISLRMERWVTMSMEFGMGGALVRNMLPSAHSRRISLPPAVIEPFSVAVDGVIRPPVLNKRKGESVPVSHVAVKLDQVFAEAFGQRFNVRFVPMNSSKHTLHRDEDQVKEKKLVSFSGSVLQADDEDRMSANEVAQRHIGFLREHLQGAAEHIGAGNLQGAAEGFARAITESVEVSHRFTDIQAELAEAHEKILMLEQKVQQAESQKSGLQKQINTLASTDTKGSTLTRAMSSMALELPILLEQEDDDLESTGVLNKHRDNKKAGKKGGMRNPFRKDKSNKT